MDFAIQCLLMFAVTIVEALIWTVYIRACAHGHPTLAASMSSSIMLCSAFLIISYTGNRWLLVPGVFGTFIGTYVVVRWLNNRTKTISPQELPNV